MLWHLKSLGFLLAVTQGLFILCLVPINSSITRCRGCHPDSLSKIRAKTRQMEKEAKKLFQSYLVHQGLHPPNLRRLCYEPVKWFPMGNIIEQPTAVMLQELYRTMAHMRDALQNIKTQQQSLNTPDAALHAELQSTQWAVRGLLSNIGCALCLHGTLPAASAAPEGPATTHAFQQKIEGCKVLWNYSKFLEALVWGSVRQEKWAGGDKRKRQKGTKRKPASRF